VITGIDSMKVLDQAFEAARTFRPLATEERQAVVVEDSQGCFKGRVRAIQDHIDF
jgi:hypothetical protein